MRLTTATVVIFNLLLCTPALHAEQIKIPIGDQSAELNNISRPTTGMSKASVKSLYGQPINVKAAVGKPPISSWEYANFTVYFEYDHVINSVLKPVYHESKTTVIKETITVDPAPETPREMPEEDLKLNEK